MITRLVKAMVGGEVISAAIAEAAALLTAGELVAFPTETVYGLGANALNVAAVSKIFVAKGRPSHNPLIVHVESLKQARSLVEEWPEDAERLAKAYWPGPLTLVLKKKALVPDIVTAGGNTVAVRLPDHPAARALIHACGFPLAAPSANRSNYISPTTAEHVLASLDGRIPLILDGGPCRAGIESTVIGLAGDTPTLLRAGCLMPDTILREQGMIIWSAHDDSAENADIPRLSPGRLARHYAPNAELRVLPRKLLDCEYYQLQRAGKKVFRKYMPPVAAEFEKELYAVLYQADSADYDMILIEEPPSTPEWAAARDRLQRAAHKL